MILPHCNYLDLQMRQFLPGVLDAPILCFTKVCSLAFKSALSTATIGHLLQPIELVVSLIFQF